MNCWKIFCDEGRWPELWSRWFKHQCVTVGWPPPEFRFDKDAVGDRAWSRTRNYLEEMQPGDQIVVHLSENRIGRLGEVVKKEVLDEEWDPLVSPKEHRPNGEQGRIIRVRWDLICGPKDPDLVVKLPSESKLAQHQTRFALAKLSEEEFQSLHEAMEERLNWVSSNQTRFVVERHLSDYISVFPNSLEDGLQVLPSSQVREFAFKDGSRADLLLTDKNGVPVVVEVKDGAPVAEDLRQLRRYMDLFKQETGKRPRGILVHGGSQKLRDELRAELKGKKPAIELVKYAMSLEFYPCS